MVEVLLISGEFGTQLKLSEAQIAALPGGVLK